LTCTKGGVTVACSTFGLTTDSFTNGPGASGSASLGFSNFGGWNITIVTGSSNSPDCEGIFGSGCLSDTSINTSSGKATNSLDVYFGASGFDHEGGLVVTESGSGVKGTATSAGYAAKNLLKTFSSTAAPTLTGEIGSTLSLSAPSTIFTGGPGPTGKDAFVTADIFKAGKGDNYVVTTTITAVPESASVILFGFGLLALAKIAKRRLARS
jgi:hypothetical protein